MTQSRIAVALALSCVFSLLSPFDAAAQRNPDLLAEKAVLSLPGMEAVKVDTGRVYAEAAGRSLKLDFFHPREAPGAATGGARASGPAPVVVFVNGVGAESPPLRRWGIYQSWGRLVAVSGMAAVTYDARREAPREDLAALVAHLRANAARYGIDPENVAIWACSANLPHGSRYALDPANTHVKAAVFYYGGIDTTHLRTDLPVLVARAGLDAAGLNASLNAFVARALARNAAVTAINIPNGRHAFDLVDPEETSRDAVRATLAFLRANLSEASQAGHGARADQRRAVDRHAARDWEGTLAATAAWREREPEAAQSFHLAGDAYYQLRRYREAAESYDRAGTLRWYPFITLYNAGCSWALAGDRERALAALERAVATGFYQNRRGIADDPDLVSLRDDPRFRKLVETP
ncbi:MAG TPA: hypothetical protein VFT32_05365 [Candidatus Eisenbacteria bacterium]|nr:hypothetical protein [Candidatus Eisenbacteria bacterium]